MSKYDKNRLIFFDTTLRDGEQSPGATLNIDEKVEIAKQLSALGVDVCEAGFPIASNGDFEAVKRIAIEVGPLLENRKSGEEMVIYKFYCFLIIFIYLKSKYIKFFLYWFFEIEKKN